MATAAVENIAIPPTDKSVAPPLVRWGIIAWSVLAVAVSCKLGIKPGYRTVYVTFANAALNWWQDIGLWVSGDYLYSPAFAIFFTPFAVLPVGLGGMLWNLFSIALFVVALRKFYREVLPSSAWPVDAEGFFLIITLIGAVRGIWSAQSTTLLLAMVLFAACAMVRGRWWTAAFCLAGPVHIKVWPAVGGALFACGWPKKLASRFALAIIAIGLLPFCTKLPSLVIASYSDWYQFLAQRQATARRLGGYRDAWTIWEQFAAVDKRGYLVLQAVAGFFVLAWCIWQRRRLTSNKQFICYTLAAWCFWQLLFGPGTEVMTYILASASFGWAMTAAYYSGRPRGWITAAFAITFLVGQGEGGKLLEKCWHPLVGLQPLGMLMFFGWLVINAATEPAWSDEASPQPIDRSSIRIGRPSKLMRFPKLWLWRAGSGTSWLAK